MVERLEFFRWISFNSETRFLILVTSSGYDHKGRIRERSELTKNTEFFQNWCLCWNYWSDVAIGTHKIILICVCGWAAITEIDITIVCSRDFDGRAWQIFILLFFMYCRVLVKSFCVFSQLLGLLAIIWSVSSVHFGLISEISTFDFGEKFAKFRKKRGFLNRCISTRTAKRKIPKLGEN